MDGGTLIWYSVSSSETDVFLLISFRYLSFGLLAVSLMVWSNSFAVLCGCTSLILCFHISYLTRLSPADIFGVNVRKLRRMDAIVHFFYGWSNLIHSKYSILMNSAEITGTAGAFPSSSAISRFGNNYSFFLTSVLFTFAAVGTIFNFVPSNRYSSFISFQVAWIFIGTLNVNSTSLEDELRIEGRKKNYLVQIWHRVLHFFESVYYGAILVLSRRHFI